MSVVGAEWSSRAGVTTFNLHGEPLRQRAEAFISRPSIVAPPLFRFSKCGKGPPCWRLSFGPWPASARTA